VFDILDARGPVANRVNAWNTEREDMEAVYASPGRPQPCVCTGAWNSIRPATLRLQQYGRGKDAPDGDIVDVDSLGPS
jgi:hypothetical protein